MFRRKGNTQEEENRHAEIRLELTKCFSSGLKQLQQKQHLDGELIVSNEASNYLCNVLEAIFLHGVKEGVVTRLSSYATGSNSSDIKTNFWSAVKRVTHRDVINQLKQLTQISTDVGLCRAWVRLAINDGLMVSYLNSMVSDSMALRSFYYPWAYLMDYEQPGILANHLTGLMGLRFNLSHNSSIFNTWSSTTLSLAGLAPNNRVSAPVIRLGPPPTDNRPHSDSSIQHSSSSDANNSLRDSQAAGITPTSASMNSMKTPPNTPCNPSMCNTGRDLEALKRLTVGSRTSSTGSNSSSQASHPDPSGQTPECSVTAEHIGHASSGSGSPCDPQPVRVSPFEAIKQKPRDELKREEQRILKEVLAMYDKKEEERQEREEKERLAAREKRIQERMAQMERERKEKFERERQERLAGQEQQKKLAEQEPENTKKAHQMSKPHTQTSQEKSRPQTSACGESPKSKTSDKDSDSSVYSQGSGQSPSQSSASRQRAVPVVRHKHEAEVVASTAAIDRPSSYGNSLSNMDGWTTVSPHHVEHQLEESFETMLRGYHASRGNDLTMATLEDVLDGMENTTAHVPNRRRASNNEYETFVKIELSDDEYDDFEIILAPDEELDQCKVEQLRSLCQFTGLSQQNYTCAAPNCNRGVGHFHGPGRVCAFDGKTYCENCHENQLTYIPAEIVYNWNFKKLKVATINYKFLQQVANKPLLDIDELFPHMYSKIPDMKTIKSLRTRLTSLRSYMFTCSETTARELKDKALSREHLYDKVHAYSVNDLLDVKAGKLQKSLQEIVSMCIAHVYSCGLCIQKGFICEICRDVRPIFPFEVDSTVKCKSCKAVFHRKCKTKARPCPRCIRFARRGRALKEDADDYAISPK